MAEPHGRITGVGGIFFKSKDPAALMAWYRDVLGTTTLRMLIRKRATAKCGLMACQVVASVGS